MTDLRITHIGGPTVLIELDGWRLLTDPTFDAPGRRYAFGWGSSSGSSAGPAVAVADLPPIDAVLLAHDHHGDNLDDAGRALLPSAAGTVVTTRSGARRLATERAGSHRRVDEGSKRPGAAPIEITATPCRHGAAEPPGRRRRDRLRAALGEGQRGVLDHRRHGAVRRYQARLRRGSTSTSPSCTWAASAFRSPGRSATR